MSGTVVANHLVDGLVYLDHAATTPMRAEAIAAMQPFHDQLFANPSGSHRFAR
jgi:cysteine desulfurase